jgi:hypothetical protein
MRVMMFPPSPLMKTSAGRRPVQLPAMKRGVRWTVASASSLAIAPPAMAAVIATRKTSNRFRRMLEFYSIEIATMRQDRPRARPSHYPAGR